jgi:hypothetical protein
MKMGYGKEGLVAAKSKETWEIRVERSRSESERSA